MVYKLKQNNITDELLDILIDFLHNGKQKIILNGQSSDWTYVKTGARRGSITRPLLFLIYISDLPEVLSTNVKLFADDMSLFSIVRDIASGTEELNNDLIDISKYAYLWKMILNPDLTKQAQEVLFSKKRNTLAHPNLTFNNSHANQTKSQEHLGLIFRYQTKF